MTLKRACLKCGRACWPGPRCPEHTPPPRKRRSGTYSEVAREIVRNATTCSICFGGWRADDPFVAHHVVPRVAGGSDDASNLAPAHRSCNARLGREIAEQGGWNAWRRG